MSALVKTYLALVPVMFLVDLMWLGVLMREFYKSHIGHLMSGGFVWPAVIIFYLIFVAGLVYFAVMPGVASGSVVRTVLLGAAFGFFAYATYDLTNHATLRDWPVVITVVDMAWGTILGGFTAGVGFYLTRFFS